MDTKKRRQNRHTWENAVVHGTYRARYIIDIWDKENRLSGPSIRHFLLSHPCLNLLERRSELWQPKKGAELQRGRRTQNKTRARAPKKNQKASELRAVRTTADTHTQTHTNRADWLVWICRYWWENDRWKKKQLRCGNYLPSSRDTKNTRHASWTTTRRERKHRTGLWIYKMSEARKTKLQP